MVVFLVVQLLELLLVFFLLLEAALEHFSLYVIDDESTINDNPKVPISVHQTETFVIRTARINVWIQGWCRNEKVLDLLLMSRIILARF
jgi:hypothetical protein